MDPQAAWNEMLDAVAANELFEADLRADDLLNWLDRGGFAPQTLTRLLAGEWDKLVCRYVCRKVMLAAHSSGT